MKMRDLSVEEENLLKRFVTDVYGPVYFIHSLPEFIIPPINSKVSRRDTSWRLNILESLSDGDLNIKDFTYNNEWNLEGAIEKAKDFHEKWVEKFGHSSIAEQHLMHLCVEDISRHLSGDIELMNKRPAFIEWSQRYQKPTKDKVVIPHELERYPDLKKKFLELWDTSYNTYELLVDELTKYLLNSTERKENESTDKFKNRVLKIAFEDARYALILATKTSFAVALNALDLQDILRKLMAHESEEGKILSRKIIEQAEKIAPSMLRHTQPTIYQTKVDERLFDVISKKKIGTQKFDDVVLIDYTGKDGKYKPEDVLLMHLIFKYTGKDLESIKTALANMSEAEKDVIIENSLKDVGPYDHLIDSFRSVRLKFQLNISEANWHQLLRHRMINFEVSRPSINNGYIIPPNIKSAGCTDILEKAIKASEEFYIEIYDKLPNVAPYVVTNAHKRMVLMDTDLWAFDHFINLRYTEHAQWDIRNISKNMYDIAKEILPRLSNYMGRRY